MRRIILILFVLFPTLKLNAQANKIQELINIEITILNKLYSGKFFRENLPESINKIIYFNNYTISETYKDANLALIRTECVLDSALYIGAQSKDTLEFYTIQINNNYYKLFGYMYSDFLQMEYENPYLTRKDFINLIKESKILSTRQMFFFRKSFKKGNNYKSQVGKKIELLSDTLNKNRILNTTILPVNYNEFIIYN